jgi:hypothetical protein
MRILPVALIALGLMGCAKKKPPIIPVAAAPISPAVTQPPADQPPIPPEEKPPAVVTPPRRPPARPVAPANPPATTTPSPSAPVPSLGEILPEAQRRQVEAELAQNVTKARAAIARTSGRSLTATQRETVDRIGTFLQQAEQSKSRDLSTALQLARRAALLGDDLIKSLQ